MRTRGTIIFQNFILLAEGVVLFFSSLFHFVKVHLS